MSPGTLREERVRGGGLKEGEGGREGGREGRRENVY